MRIRTNTRGILLWIDDRFEGVDLKGASSAMWHKIFGSHSNLIFRLMDLHLEVAASYEEAMMVLENLEREGDHQTCIFAIVDLMIPDRDNMEPAMKYGIAVGRELLSRGYPFVFLSANSDASSSLEKVGLGNIPYYVKERGDNIWLLPDSLARVILGEFRNRISWITLEGVINNMHADSDVVANYNCRPEVFRSFPFFASYRDFVEHSEYRDNVNSSQTIAIRSTRYHSDEFVQQALSVMMNEMFRRNPGMHKVRFGYSNNAGYMGLLDGITVADDPFTIAIIRVLPELTPLDEFKDVLQNAGRRAGTTLFVLPNDETSEGHVELLRESRIISVGDLPQSTQGDSEAREELIRRCSSLIFQNWIQKFDTGKALAGKRGYLSHPELFINPIDWMILLESEKLAEELSDPHEVLKELHDSFFNDQSLNMKMLETIAKNEPLPYEQLLQVGRRTFLRSNVKEDFNTLVERALDFWLSNAWDFPYGLGTRFMKNWHRPCISNGIRPSSCKENAGLICNAKEDKQCGLWEVWQDQSYHILVRMLEEYTPPKAKDISLPGGQRDMMRVDRFTKALGSLVLLTGNYENIDWEHLDYLRWPHQRFPMPSAITRRLRKAGRYLWVQPEGLDLATVLPMGRTRYRSLTNIVDQYSSVLAWSRDILEYLPLGWKQSVGYLTDIIFSHQVAHAWKTEPDKVWNALLGILRNGLPIMYIADRIAQGTLLTGKKEETVGVLSGANGYGTILGKLRGSANFRVGGFIIPLWPESSVKGHMNRIGKMVTYLEALKSENGSIGKTFVSELEASTQDLINRISTHENGHGKSKKNNGSLWETLGAFVSDPVLAMTSNHCYSKQVEKEIRSSSFDGYIPSLFGSKADLLWQAMDAMVHLHHITRRYRYFDGYHLLSCIHDLRLENKDTRPQVKTSAIEAILDVFLSSLEGLIAQLSWVVEAIGEKDLATMIRPPSIQVSPPKEFIMPSREDLSRMVCVDKNPKGKEGEWAVYTLGIPGKGTADTFSYHDTDLVKKHV